MYKLRAKVDIRVRDDLGSLSAKGLPTRVCRTRPARRHGENPAESGDAAYLSGGSISACRKARISAPTDVRARRRAG